MALEPDGLANAFEAALPQAWQDVKHEPLPAGDPNDRKPLFLAIARGLLKYLHDNQLDMVSTMDLSIAEITPVTNKVSNLQLNVTGV
jgi:hypothetical protein